MVVAPSGTGKSTLIKKLLAKYPMVKWSVSCTTRPMRTGEVDGEDYLFISVPEFESRIKENDFVEWAKVHSNYYGTSKSFLEDQLNQGYFVLCDLDVQGTDSLKNVFKDQAVAIFIEPPSIEELEKRLLKRGTDSIEVINERIKNAKYELTRKNDYDYLVVNDDILKAYESLDTIFSKVVGDKVV